MFGGGRGDNDVYVDYSGQRLVYLYASPLVDRQGQELRILDTNQEIDLIRQSLCEANREIRFRVDVATPQNLRTVATNGAVMIHYSGHGSPDILAFENGRGEVHRLEVESLRAFFSAGGVQTKVVFVSACHSEMAGRKFTEAGVEHVIALNNRVTDNSSRVFAQNFYISLFKGKKTVQEAFDIASNMVMVMEGGKPSDEKKFLLLPEDSNHDTIIFPNCPVGEYVDETEDLAYNGCDRAPKSFIGRNRAMQQIYSFLGTSNNRWVTIRGERGIGKTALASRVCEYMNERKLFDAIYFVPLHRLGASTSSDVNELAEMFGRCMEEEIRNRDFRNGTNVGDTFRVGSIDDLIAAVQYPSRPNRGSRRKIFSNGGGRSDLQTDRILFVVDNCDIFVQKDMTSSDDSCGVKTDVPEVKRLSSQQQTAVEGTAVSNPLSLLDLLNNLFRRTDNVKCLLTASSRILGFQEVLLINEPEKVITLERLTDKQTAELMVKLSPRALKPSEMRSMTAATALDTLSARPVVKDLEGHPRAIAMFCSILADRGLDDSEEMRSFARNSLLRARAWQELRPASTAPSTAFSSPVTAIEKQSHFPIPVAVPVTTPSNSSRFTAPSFPHRVMRATSDNSSNHFHPPPLPSSNSSGALFSSTPLTKCQALNFSPPVCQTQIQSPGVVSSHRNGGEKLQHRESLTTKLNINTVDRATVEEAYRQARETINDQACADVWAKVTALAAGKQGVLPDSVKWSSLISALSESLEIETKATRTVEDEVVAFSRRLTKDDAKFIYYRMQLDETEPLTSGRGHVDYIVDRSRFLVFCEWWSPLLKALDVLRTEFTFKNPILIHGFLGRQQTEAKLLSSGQVGMFLLRFSESHAGYLVVSFTDYVTDSSHLKVHHCLVNVRKDGISIYFERGEYRYQSLLELIMNCDNLLILYPSLEKDAFKEAIPFASSK